MARSTDAAIRPGVVGVPSVLTRPSWRMDSPQCLCRLALGLFAGPALGGADGTPPAAPGSLFN